MMIYRARFQRIEKAMAPTDNWDIKVSIALLPPEDERRKIEAADPGVEYVWIGPAKKLSGVNPERAFSSNFSFSAAPAHRALLRKTGDVI
jgi:hypothetical protein